MILKNPPKTLTTSAALVSGLLLITSCSSGDGDGSSATATVPANAVVINAANAEATIQSAVSTKDTLNDTSNVAASVEVIPNANFKRALDKIKPALTDSLNNSLNNTGIDPVTAGLLDESGACFGPTGGTYSVVGDISYNDTSFSESGTATYVNCDEYNFILNGSINFSFTVDYSTGDYSDRASGTFSVLETGATSTISFSNLHFAVAGNYSTYTYTISQMSYAIDFIDSNGGSNGYLVTLTAPIVESSGDFFSLCPESGHITITGADGTTAEGIYNGDDTMTIKANGEIVNTAAQCYY